MPTLYELAPQFRILMDRAATADEITEEEMAALLMTQEQTTDKLENYAIVVTELEADQEKIANEIERLQAWKTRIENNEDRVKQAIAQALDTIGVDKYDTKYHHLKFTKSTRTIADPGFVAWAQAAKRDDLLSPPKDPTPALANIKKAILAGDTGIPAHLEENRSLKVK